LTSHLLAQLIVRHRGRLTGHPLAQLNRIRLALSNLERNHAKLVHLQHYKKLKGQHIQFFSCLSP
jgi:hypothetical protein